MNTRTLAGGAAMLAAITTLGVLPGVAMAQGYDRNEAAKRQKTKNDWRNMATAGAGAALLGVLTKNNAITIAGAAGALYSYDRYNKDKASQKKIEENRRSSWDDRRYDDRNRTSTASRPRVDWRDVNRNGRR